MIASYNQMCRKLSLTRCPGISDDGVLILQRVCPQLKYLTLHDLDRTVNLTKNLLPSSPAGDNSPQQYVLPFQSFASGGGRV